MPRGDGTGPIGIGPMIGRCMGYCAESVMPAYANIRFGRGCGRGFRNMYYQTGLPGWVRDNVYSNDLTVCTGKNMEQVMYEKSVLQNQMTALEKQLNEVHERLKNLERSENSEKIE